MSQVQYSYGNSSGGTALQASGNRPINENITEFTNLIMQQATFLREELRSIAALAAGAVPPPPNAQNQIDPSSLIGTLRVLHQTLMEAGEHMARLKTAMIG